MSLLIVFRRSERFGRTTNGATSRAVHPEPDNARVIDQASALSWLRGTATTEWIHFEWSDGHTEVYAGGDKPKPGSRLLEKSE